VQIELSLALIAIAVLTGVALASAVALRREQRRAHEAAFRYATEDALTGLRTRAYLFAALERELARSERTGRGFCLLMIDLDELKGINDRYGHLAGDRALRSVGEVVRDGIRRIDTGARFGVDEFVVCCRRRTPPAVGPGREDPPGCGGGGHHGGRGADHDLGVGGPGLVSRRGRHGRRAARARGQGDVPFQARRPRRVTGVPVMAART
jgi:GGDEF domain-containing protein